MKSSYKEQVIMWRDYHVVDSIEHALELLKENGASARIIAGGTDMIIAVSYTHLTLPTNREV